MKIDFTLQTAVWLMWIVIPAFLGGLVGGLVGYWLSLYLY